MSRLRKLYESYEGNPDIGFVVMKGNGNAFCAGADIVSVRDMIKKGNIEGSKEIFRRVYGFAYLLHTYLKPNVAILDGVTMGGGAAISIPGTFRIATEKTVYATPETLIGLHPDAGASFHLSHLPGYLGEYLGLTGDRLNGVEMIACGLATHYAHSTVSSFGHFPFCNITSKLPQALPRRFEKKLRQNVDQLKTYITT
ncbi:putative 3-hydroxyisobutyryl-CoA hydrolase [Helianthus anomalus]